MYVIFIKNIQYINYKKKKMFVSLSPITATTSVKTNLKSHQNISQQELFADDNIFLVNIYYKFLSFYK